MEELVAKRYLKALKKVFSSDQLIELSLVFSALADGFKNEKFAEFMQNPDISDDAKATFLLDAVRSVESDELNNFMRLLIEEKRVEIIPALSREMKKEIARLTNSYKGCVYSNDTVDQTTLNKLSEGIGKKIDSHVDLEFIQHDFDGIKVEIEDLGFEIDFSKSKIDAQIIEHVLQAI
jgi:F-type H+-transporting ATPase subunit delta